MKKNTIILLTLLIVIVLADSAGAVQPLRFTAHLEGFNLAGEPVPTNATGQATIEVIDDGTAIRYRVNVAGIRNLWMAHIHVASVPVEVTDQGLIDAMLEGRASVVIHTNDFDPNTPTGVAGGSPPGEIRGTIR